MTLPDGIKFPVVLEGHASTKEGYIIYECALIQSEVQKEVFIDKFSNTNPKITIKQFPFILEAWDDGVAKKVLIDRQTMENDVHLKRFIEKHTYFSFKVVPLKNTPYKKPIKNVMTISQYSLWWSASKKSFKYVLMYVIIPVLVTLIAGYFIFLFGWNK